MGNLTPILRLSFSKTHFLNIEPLFLRFHFLFYFPFLKINKIMVPSNFFKTKISFSLKNESGHQIGTRKKCKSIIGF